MANRNQTGVWTLLAVILTLGHDGGWFQAVSAQKCVSVQTETVQAVFYELIDYCLDLTNLWTAVEDCLACKKAYWLFCCPNDAHTCTLLCSNTTIVGI